MNSSSFSRSNQAETISDDTIRDFVVDFWSKLNSSEDFINSDGKKKELSEKDISDRVGKWWDTIVFDDLNSGNTNNSEIDKLIEFNNKRKANNNINEPNKNDHDQTIISKKVIFDNGDSYLGELLDGKLHGHGKYIWKEGSKYIGNWINGLKHGRGIIFFPNGTRYDGEFFNDQYHGRGVYYNEDGSKIDVNYVQGRLVENKNSFVSSLPPIDVDLLLGDNNSNISKINKNVLFNKYLNDSSPN